MSVADAMPELRPLAAEFTYLCHLGKLLCSSADIQCSNPTTPRNRDANQSPAGFVKVWKCPQIDRSIVTVMLRPASELA
jgi:hypothetical protein